ncbi:hypothetical protein ACMHYJ_14185 [Castellaniella hirudinis]|uniref:hypothetical protein n=1 Tax=Castellaniella hirudinis TaxID=1144617 RepID=UPI0039C2B1C5
MTPQRQAQILAGQTNIARKVYEAVTPCQNHANTSGEIVAAMYKNTGSGCEHPVLMGCLKKLKESGLIREVVPGSFRRTHIKEEKPVATKPNAEQKNPTPKAQAKPQDSMQLLGDIAARVRAAAGTLNQIADDIDTAAICLEEKSGEDKKKLETLRQLQALLKG